jgi:glutaredoxin-like protein DUF836
MSSKNIKFMTTLGCHLCEQAWAMLEYLLNTDPDIANRVSLIKVEISEDNTLLEKYGIRIPVLVSEKGELGWPFEFEELEEWLAN